MKAADAVSSPPSESGTWSDWPQDTRGEFLVGGQPLSQVVDAAGGTPCYLYDRQRLTDRVRRLRGALSPAVRIHYAIKANPMPALVCHMARLVDGLDVASSGELRVALDSGMAPEHISFAGPGKGEHELKQAHAAGILVNVESFRDVRLLAALSRATGRPARVAIRANLPFSLRASGMKMTGGAQQFGVDAEQVPELVAEIQRAGLTLEGFHLFAGSQNLRADAIIEAQARSCELALEWTEKLKVPLRSLNLGGGFGIPHTPSDKPLEVGPVLEHLNTLAGRVRAERPETEVVIELGRYLVGEAGLYVCRVLDRKLSREQVFLVTDGGMHQHLAASGNFGQVIRKNYPVAVNGAPTEAEVASVVGPLCTPLDLLADKARLGAAKEGDLVVVFQSGAYGRTASPRDFLGHPEPREALV
ncbi:pyridoxal-dependent decarboxylase, exosortase A system-associated [Myxococcus sp. K15C18031901]|uniref:pyridoxal-dependent decarboxylase, exosortase A system-associated n=1 Tax=Myxococcus dinghuensis TaxID=2906761 RepID=UPI0020A7656B|nr:pyridoxal-dependent decarboxylase, exosortase A system-associated [Myxococcus dinghuensis]MCP3102892.1 pyridoxal-dependent decarboxylase, exosortase A system-associated [Myxococcus dinghuensis]